MDRTDHAVLQVDDLVRLVGDRLFMGYADDGHARPVYLPQQVHYLLRGFAVQGARRFVGEDDLGLVDQCPGDGHALFLAARHFVGHVVGPVAEPQSVEVFEGFGIAFAARNALVVEGKGDVFDRVLVVYQVERLENIADHVVAGGSGLRLAQVLDQAPVQEIFARVVVVQDPEDVQQGRFARSRGPHDRNQLALFDFEVDTLEYMQRSAVVVGLVDVFEYNHIERE